MDLKSRSTRSRPGRLRPAARRARRRSRTAPVDAAALLDALPDPVALVTPDGRIRQTNAAFRRMCTAGADDLCGRLIDAVGTALAALSPTSAPPAAEIADRDRDGLERWTRWTFAGRFDADGRLTEVLASGRDVTEDRLHQIVLQRLMTAMPAPGRPVLETVDTLLDIARVQLRTDAAAFARRTPAGGIEILAAVGGDYGRRLPEAVFAAAADLARGPAAYAQGAGAPDRDRFGVGAPGSLVSHPLRLPDGSPAAVIFHSDRPHPRPFLPGDQRIAALLAQWLPLALERQAQVHALADSRAELALILEMLPVHVAYIDGTGQTIAANGPARMASRPADSRGLDTTVLAAGTPLLGRMERWHEPSGAPRWMRTDRIPLPSDGTPRLLMVATDVSELVEKERQLADANEGLKQFAYVASHDLQEPLRKIGIFTDLLLTGLARRDEEDIAYASRVIQQSARRASRLIRDLLAWSRIGNRPLERAAVPFAAVMRDTLAEVIGNRDGISVEVTDDMADLLLRADPIQVRQLAENLIVNAVKYRHPDRPARLRLHFGRDGAGGLVFELEDNGIGFDPAHGAVIFEPFRRLHGERQYSGSGIGLAICAKVCERHGWRITAVGRPGQGAVFRIEMPPASLK